MLRTPPSLTFSHWSGVTPYTSSYEFAGSCVFVKQSPGVLSLRPRPSFDRKGRSYPEVTTAFLPSSLRSTHSFAWGYSPRPPVSVYGTVGEKLSLEVFLGKLFCEIFQAEARNFRCTRSLHIKVPGPGFSSVHFSSHERKSIIRSTFFPSSPHRIFHRSRNINRVSISCGSRHCLRTD